MKPKTYTCESCGMDAGSGGVYCRDCHKHALEGLLGSVEWRENASTRKGDREGESMLESMQREWRRLR